MSFFVTDVSSLKRIESGSYLDKLTMTVRLFDKRYDDTLDGNGTSVRLKSSTKPRDHECCSQDV
jgi:hypothetical protein